MTDNTEVENSEASGTIKESGVDVSEFLTDGFMESFLPSLENLQDRLGELTQNQGILTETMQQENDKYVDCQSARNLAVMVRVYSQFQKPY